MPTSGGVRYTWEPGDGPPDGTYEAEFDRYEDAPGGDGNDRVALLIVDPDGEGLDAVHGSVVLPTDRVPGIDGSPVRGRESFAARIENGELVELRGSGESGP